MKCTETYAQKLRLQYRPVAPRSVNAVVAIRLLYDNDYTTYRARLLPFDAIRREQKNYIM